jgi:H+/Cl- antiporter ClcA
MTRTGEPAAHAAERPAGAAHAGRAATDTRRYLGLVLVGALVGMPAALAAAGFLALVHELESWLWDDLPRSLGASSPWYLVVGLPVAGAAVVVAARTLLPGDGGHDPLEGIGGGVTPVEYAPGILLAAVGTLAFGAVLGPEGPLIALGSAVGVAIRRMVRVSREADAVLGTAGSFSAVSALFGGPIVAGMLMLESGLTMGTALLPALVPGMVAAAVGYVLFVALGDWGGLNTTALAVPDLPLYQGHPRPRPPGRRGRRHRRRAGDRDGAPRGRPRRRRAARGMPALLRAGGLAVGLPAQAADLLGGNSQDVLFSGQSAIPTVDTERSASIVLVVVAAKAAAYAVSLGCGFRGGPVFPAIFTGIGLAMFAVIALDVSPTLAVAVGAGAGMAAGTRLMFSALVFSALLVGRPGLDAVPATVLAIVAAWLTATALDRRAAPQPIPRNSPRRAAETAATP